MSNQTTPQPPGAFITHLTKAGFKRYGPAKSSGDFEIHNLDLTSLNLNVGILTPFLISKRLSGHRIVNTDQLAAIQPDLEDIASQSLKKLRVLAIGGKLTRIDDALIKTMAALGFAIIDKSTIEAVGNTNDPNLKADLLSAALVQFFGREALSPYVSGRPAVGGRFFGRSNFLKKLAAGSGCFTIVGNRRIGKTSLLKQIRELLKLKNFRTGDVYGATCMSTEDVVWTLLQGLDQFREAEHVLTEPHRARLLATYVHKIPNNENRPVAVFVDELDHILEFDAKQNYAVMHLLRETFFGNEFCCIFLAGFRKTARTMRSIDAAGFNFTKLFELPLFTREETYGMVSKPLTHLGIKVDSTSDLPELIFKESGGHPELIQIQCTEVIQFVEQYRKVPSGDELLSHVINTPEFKQKVYGTFLANANVYEELVCYLLIDEIESAEHPSEYEFGHEDVDRVLRKVDIRNSNADIWGLISNLKSSGIITQVTGRQEKYRFSAPQLVNYCVGINLETSIENALERVNSSDDTLWTEPPPRAEWALDETAE